MLQISDELRRIGRLWLWKRKSATSIFVKIVKSSEMECNPVEKHEQTFRMFLSGTPQRSV